MAPQSIAVPTHIPSSSRRSKQPQASKTRKIVEIEGLRGIALTLVVLFHLFGNGRISGGVDVFLVISAFLLSRSMLRKATRPEGPKLVEHFSGVTARLVPAAAVVLVAVGAVTMLLLPATVQRQNLQEILASALYFENWELISSQLSYGAAGPDASPLQHFWSLSVQGQFFLTWPLLVIGVVWIARRMVRSPRRLLLTITVFLTVISAVYAFDLTSTDQPVAYFHTLARFWELGLGAILGLTLHRIALSDSLRAFLGWAGLTLIVSCGFVIDGGHLFPGPWTLWPVIGTLLVIVGAGSSARYSSVHLLETPILRFFASIAYPLYLWHWPLLIFYLQIRDRTRIGWAGALFVFGLSVVLAWFTTRIVETPVAGLRSRVAGLRLLILPVAITLVVTVTASTAIAAEDAAREEQLEALSSLSPNHIGARALLEDGPPIVAVDPLPAPAVAFDDLPAIYAEKCIQNYRGEPGMDEVLICESPVEAPTKTVVMTGGSHVQQWYPAMAAIADQEGWALLVIDKDGCRLTLADLTDGMSSCESWSKKAIPTIISKDPDVVFTVATETASPEAATEFISDRQVGAWRDLTDAGVPVVAVRDTPRFDFRVPECVEASAEDLSDCGIPRDETYAETSPFFERNDIPALVAHLDLSNAFCSSTRCEPIVGNVMAYRDDDHMTATYALTIAPALREALEEAMPTLF